MGVPRSLKPLGTGPNPVEAAILDLHNGSAFASKANSGGPIPSSRAMDS